MSIREATRFLVMVVSFLLLLACPSEGKGLLLTPDELTSRMQSVSGGEVAILSTQPRFGEMFQQVMTAGKIKRVTFVVSSRHPFNDALLNQWKNFIGLSFSGDEKSFRSVDGGFRGTIAGVDVSMIPVDQWRGEGGLSFVVVDLPFLLSLFVDETRTPVTELPGTMLAILSERKVALDNVVLHLSDRSDLPLERGYLATLSQEALASPEKFREGLPEPWALLRSGENLVVMGMTDRAVERFDSYLKSYPGDPSVLYRIGFSRVVDGEMERGLKHLHAAFDSDPYYIRGFSATAFLLFSKGRFDEAERVLRAGLLRVPEDIDLKVGLARVTLAQAKKLIVFERKEGEARFGEIQKIGIPPELFQSMQAEWEEAKAKPLSVPGMSGASR